ncbi:MAG: transglycosylase domain-containing protein [Clostridia bacterium]|nr:transglycosylase domain-containing protein [Clostridia bacterium]
MKKFLLKLFIFLIILIIIACSILFMIGFTTYSKALKEKPLLDRISIITNNEHFVKYDDLSKNYINAVIATEDHRYYDHGPVDYIGILRAIFVNIKSKELNEGGSTITQQVAKNVILSQEASLSRKLAEIFGAYDLEKHYSKNEILEIYVNTAYFGDGYYGIYDASYGYFNKAPKDLNLDEASMLAGVPNAPSVYAPTVNPNLAKKRQKHVLNKMMEYGYISENDAKSIK